MTACIRFDPSERLSKAELYARAARQIAAGTRPTDIAIPGIGLSRLSRPGVQPRPDHAVEPAPASTTLPRALPG